MKNLLLPKYDSSRPRIKLLRNFNGAGIFPACPVGKRSFSFGVLWQFGKNAAKPPRLPAFLAPLGGARQKIRSSYIQNTPPVGIWQTFFRLAPR